MQTNGLCLIKLFEIELFDHLTVSKQKSDVLIEMLVIHSDTWNYLTVWKRMRLGSFWNVIN